VSRSQALVLTRVLGAPVERVWESWCDPDRMLRWWGAQGADPEVPCVKEAVPLERLVYELRFAGKTHGRTVRNEVAFEDLGDGRTKLTITIRVGP
jgi:uncharacterized protein YndB with AHSA1/START domain